VEGSFFRVATLEEVKLKFDSVQKINQSLKDELIRKEEQLKSTQESYDNSVNKLFELTNTNTVEDAKKYVETMKLEVNTLLEDINSKLSKFLDKDGE